MSIVIVTLHCEHAIMFEDEWAPRTRESVFCYQCDAMRCVTHVPHKWTARCEDCPWDRRYHIDGRLVRGVRQHLARYPSHTVVMQRDSQDGPTFKVSQDRMRHPLVDR